MFAALGLLLMTAAAPAAICAPVDGAQTLWAKPETRWVFVGEMHGTAETPKAFAELACLAAQTRRPVAIAVEHRQSMQPAIDAWLASDGGPAARAALTGGEMWQRKMQDGRTSVAMLDLYETLRQMKRAGRITGVFAFAPEKSAPGAQAYNKAMADAIQAVPVPAGGLVLVLVGNIHAMKTQYSFGTQSFMPAAGQMPAGRAVSVDVVGNRGMAWTCELGVCAAHDLGNRADTTRGVTPAGADNPRSTRSSCSPPKRPRRRRRRVSILRAHVRGRGTPPSVGGAGSGRGGVIGERRRRAGERVSRCIPE